MKSPLDPIIADIKAERESFLKEGDRWKPIREEAKYWYEDMRLLVCLETGDLFHKIVALFIWNAALTAAVILLALFQ